MEGHLSLIKTIVSAITHTKNRHCYTEEGSPCVCWQHQIHCHWVCVSCVCEEKTAPWDKTHPWRKLDCTWLTEDSFSVFSWVRVNSAAEKNPSLNKPCGIALVVGSFSGRMYKALRIWCLYLPVHSLIPIYLYPWMMNLPGDFYLGWIFVPILPVH